MPGWHNSAKRSPREHWDGFAASVAVRAAQVQPLAANGCLVEPLWRAANPPNVPLVGIWPGSRGRQTRRTRPHRARFPLGERIERARIDTGPVGPVRAPGSRLAGTAGAFEPESRGPGAAAGPGRRMVPRDGIAGAGQRHRRAPVWTAARARTQAPAVSWSAACCASRSRAGSSARFDRWSGASVPSDSARTRASSSGCRTKSRGGFV